MTYVVAGVTGHTGSVVAETLLAQGKKVRVVVRDQAKGAPFAAKGAEVAVADLTDATALAKALSGAEGAFLLVPPNPSVPDFKAYQRKVIDAEVAALATAKTPHVVFLSSIGAQHPDGTGPIAALHYAEQRFATLAHTRTTALRAAYFMENLGSALGTVDQGFIGSFVPADHAFEMIATVDIGKLAAKLLVEGAKTSTVVQLGGGKYSMSDVAKAIGTIVGKPIKVAEAELSSMAQALVGYGMQPDLAGLYQEMMGGIASVRVSFESGHRQVSGTTTLAQVLGRLLGKS